MPRGNKKTLTSFVTSEEYEDIKKTAAQAKISISKFVRQVSLGYELKSKADHEAVLALLRVNRDLSSLGNLFKLALDREALDENQGREMIDSINELKKEIMEKVRAIYDPQTH